MNLTKILNRNSLIEPPTWLVKSVQYETVMGSHAYGVFTESSDLDIYGFCIPPIDVVFPFLKGEIEDFGTREPRFNQFQKHHIDISNIDSSNISNKLDINFNEIDISIYNIVRYFHLCMENNPNMIDSLFTNNLSRKIPCL